VYKHVDSYQTVEEFPLMRRHSQRILPVSVVWNR
jgi:hypothetical protein